ncbi:hypothetical protein Tco_0583316 [Tanacetum coccineum]
MLKLTSTFNLSLPFLLVCTSPSCENLHSKCLVKNKISGDDKKALAFEEDGPDALAFETDEKECLAFNLEALVFLPPDLENMYSGMSSYVKSSYHFSKCLDDPFLDTMSRELYIISP